MIASNRQVSYVLLGMIFGYILGNSVQGAFIGGVIGFLISYRRWF
jgi:hypothetical protein